MTLLALPGPRARVPTLEVGTRALPFGNRAYIMGVVNVTPDSFSDGGEFFGPRAAIAHGQELARSGATLLDVGGESTRPGAAPVSLHEELQRVIPVVEGLAQTTEAWISVDTTKAEVARQAINAGAHIINDISAMRFDADMARVVADHQVGVVLMHTAGRPANMQDQIPEGDIVEEVISHLSQRVESALAAGIARHRIILDPGIGFGKSVDQNFRLIAELGRLRTLGCPVLLGTSRKSLIGAVTGRPPSQRLMGTAATVACGIMCGADIVRVHDVSEMVDVVQVTQALCQMPAGD
ncbi:dihydropteroate synthase [Lujinxingia litoralis]|uniref:Dihydropteroate synthase n=1 Tax=Lujinxingia litoralis TaxID=2211119 RepID=A0A328C671_9DELT|nr:dihydropteroate synthase [Lujinxingia litoralis]RAL21623.1 dihydropteroate synthase [Lujinxingia litoralis]